ncbi:hypothetical protein DL765_002699 [Monosporascus sp. GIB2]|nr:hypothetical protein DL765_002699 [Monosporascus sp. GIB2]
MQRDQGFKVFSTLLPFEDKQHLEEIGARVLICDITKEEDVVGIRKAIEDETEGRLFVLINNAGICYTMTAADTDVREVEKMFAVNVFGHMRIVHHFHRMVVQAKGVIVNIGSIGGIVPYVYGSSYNASKAALHHYGDTLRVEMKPFGVRVVNVISGEVSTNILKTDQRSQRELPHDSLYQPLAEEFKAHISRTPKTITPDRYAEGVVKEILKDSPAIWFWHGAQTSLVRWCDMLLPRTFWDSMFWKEFKFGKLAEAIRTYRLFFPSVQSYGSGKVMDIDGFALVTGAGSGIGRDCAIAYAIEGAKGVAFADINAEGALAAAEESKTVATNPDYQAISIQVDVSDEASVEQMVKATIAKFGRIDYNVNSAGVGVENPRIVSEASVPEFQRFFDINVKGTLHCLKAVSSQMRTQAPRILPSRSNSDGRNCGRGSIINLGSSNSYVATRHVVQYTTSKHAVLGMTRNAGKRYIKSSVVQVPLARLVNRLVALDLASDGVRVNAICPSWVETPMVERATAGDPDLAPLMKRAVPLGRIALREEISDVIMFMSSPRSSYVTGAGWMVDGGTTLQPGPISEFPAPGLRHSQRFITSYNKEGKGVFLPADDGDHHRIMVGGHAVANIIYSTLGYPVDLKDEKDIKYARENEPGLHIQNGTVVRLIDFAPGLESPMHRAMSLDYGVVIEGEFEITLDSGESRIMRPGDISVQRATFHKWRNCSKDKPGRMLFILLDVQPFSVNGVEIKEDLGDLASEYEKH